MTKKKTHKKALKWEVRQTADDRWGIFLQQKFCKTDEPVCYGVSRNQAGAQASVDRMNNPDYWHEEE
jgi:hypothetical protein